MENKLTDRNNDIAIKVEHVSKKYCRALKHSMLYGTIDIARNAIGLSSNSHQLRKNEFWALDDISFEVKKGEILGIIGLNGSGKTTLLKLLNGIFWPDKGKITVKGKVGALIQVGAGFHPLLTGRENIYLNAAILGIGKREVNKKFDDIVNFADIGDFLDTSIKYYSSGMLVRLGFAIAVHCEPDILLVDEILAVGDLPFRLKCNKKISKIRQKGNTILLVSHNMNAIRNVCEKVIWLNNGKIKKIGDVHRICELYEEYTLTSKKNNYEGMGQKFNYDPSVKITKVEFLDNNDKICTTFNVGDYFKLRIHLDCRRKVKNPIFSVGIFNQEGVALCFNRSHFDGYNFDQIYKKTFADFYFNKLSFVPGKYSCTILISEKFLKNNLDIHEKCYVFTVAGKSRNQGLMNFFPKWSLKVKDV